MNMEDYQLVIKQDKLPPPLLIKIHSSKKNAFQDSVNYLIQ